MVPHGCDVLLIIFSFRDEFKFCIQKLPNQDLITMFDRPDPSCSKVGLRHLLDSDLSAVDIQQYKQQGPEFFKS